MLEIAEFREERAELQSLLDSGVLDRAPHLVSFLTYVCKRYFQGEADQIKEYTIGVEAFRRQSDFDPKRDSIVRVEAHRLRKRLEEYYAGEGASHRVRIVIPNGQYIPHFVLRAQAAASGPKLPPVTVNTVDPHAGSDFLEGRAANASSPSVMRKRWSWPAVLALAIVASLVVWLFARASGANSPARQETWVGPSTQPVPAEFRMLAGYHSNPFTDRQGRVWNADAYYSGGVSAAVPEERRVEGVPDAALLKSQRQGEFRYDIPLASGTYELRLYFAETEYGPGNPLGGGETSRLFQVLVNGEQVLERFDPLAESGGPNRLLVRIFKDVSPAADGKLHLAFQSFKAPGRADPSPAFLNALEILQSKPGWIHCLRIVTQDQPVTDVDGRVWSSDEYFFGGMLATRDASQVTARDATLYRGERYGNFAYHIPLAPGKYRLTLHFAETWFGTPESRQSGSESRRFNVIANGAPLLQNFEIRKEAGVHRELIKVFDNMQPNDRGALWLEFIPLENYAEVNAIEIEQMP